MSTTLDEPQTISTEPADEDLFVVTKTSSTSATPVDQDAQDASDERKADASRRPWYSGWCGGGPECNDGKQTNKVGEQIRHCLHVGINGTKAPYPYVVCACTCHVDDVLPDLSSVEAAHALAKTLRD